ncbi:MAG: acetylxylan esterase [Verrucomicrobia bacterium]|nr:acetylxylan esterase [Verrucomicrobiota bacterium]
MAAETRKLAFSAASADEARDWQLTARARLTELMLGGRVPDRVPLAAQVLREIPMPAGGYRLEEVMLQTVADRRARVWVASPLAPGGKVAGILALHGHGGSGEQVVRGEGLYWYGRALAEMGYVVVAPDIGQHDLQHAHWTLMGERVWDALRCVDYLAERADVDPERMAVCGLSLGGETAMYVGALDERLKLVVSSGWLTTVANMKQGHCPCWNFPGLEQHFDFADIFACVAPRVLVCELGDKERAPGGFPVEIGKATFAEIRRAYQAFGATDAAVLSVHPGGHVFNGRDVWDPLLGLAGPAWPWRETPGTSDEELLRRGEIARRCFSRALRLHEAWWALRDPVTGLFPRRTDQPVWAPQDNAADMLPFLALTTHFTDPRQFEDVIRVIARERELTTRTAGLPDWFALTNRAWVYPNPDLPRLIFNAAEYCKDGLLPLTEVLGRGVWTDRLCDLLDAIFAAAPVASDFGPLPANDAEVNGDLLQALARMQALTGDPKFLEWGLRIADAYCLEVIPRNGGIPAHRWDFTKHAPITDELNLNDHGNEIVGGLAEIFVAASVHAPAKAAAYREPLGLLIRRLQEKARNPDGFWVQRVRASTGEVLDPGTPDTWGYALSGILTIGDQLEAGMGSAAAGEPLKRINQGRYLDWNGADSYADSIEGGLLVLNRLPEPAGFAWLHRILPIFLGRQRDDGIVEGWYGDGNYARTALMAALYFTQGTRVQPWRPDVRFGAVQTGDGRLELVIRPETAWSGRVIFDRPRHRTNLNLPKNYPRLNEFPEWFTVEAGSRYQVTVAGRERFETTRTGSELAQGLWLALEAGEMARVTVRPAKSPIEGR